MISKLRTYTKFGNLFCGVEHTYCNGKEIINSLQLKKKKEEFVIENSLECESITELKNHLPAKQHLFLIVNTEKVLFKTLKGVFNTSKEAMTVAFPNLLLEDFYYEILQTDTHTFIAICRKNVVENYIKTYHENQLRVIGFSLGNVVASQLVGFVKNIALETSNKVIVFDEQKISTISSLTTATMDKQDINGIQVSSKRVLSLAGILAYYAAEKRTISNFSKRLHTLNTDFKGHLFFDIGLKVGLGTVFVLLLVSFLLFSNYTTNINELTASLELNKTHKNELLKLSELVQKKEQLVTRFSLASSKTSWYITQLGSAIPESVLLSEIQYQPLVKKIKEEEEILLHLRILTVKGMANSGTDFSNWIYTLEREDWIKKVIVKSYGLGKKKATEFELSIKIKG